MKSVEGSGFRATTLSSVAGDDLDDVTRFSGFTELADQVGLIVRFEPFGEGFLPWIGIFDAGYSADVSISGVFGFADSDRRCLVVSRGQAFVGNAENRTDWSALRRPFPVTFAQSVDVYGFVLVADMTSVAALAPDGAIWSASDLADGELIVDKVTPEGVQGRGWHAPSQEFRSFALTFPTARAPSRRQKGRGRAALRRPGARSVPTDLVCPA